MLKTRLSNKLLKYLDEYDYYILSGRTVSYTRLVITTAIYDDTSDQPPREVSLPY